MHTRRLRDVMGRVTHQIGRVGHPGFDDLPFLDLWHQAGQHRNVRTQPIQLIKAYVFDTEADLVRRRDPVAGEVHHAYDATGRIRRSTSLPPIPQDLRAFERVDWAQRADQLRDDAPAHAPLCERFAWDRVGNPLPPQVAFHDRHGQPTAARTNTYVEHNRVRLHEDKRYEYDALGRLVEKFIGNDTVQRLRWNAENQLTAVVTTRAGLTRRVHFDYDALGRRIRKRGDGGAAATVTFTWSGMRLLQEQHGAKITTHVYEDEAGHVPLARIEQLDIARLAELGLEEDHARHPQHYKPRIYHVHANSAGAPEELTDEDGHVVWQARYQAWGRMALNPPTSPDGNAYAMPHFDPEAQHLRLQGQYADAETGLHYNTFRYYDPDVGRFICQDPIGLAGGINLYQYAPNAFGWIDPWGWCSVALGRNMKAAGIDRPPNTTPHHIAGDTSAKSQPGRNILGKHGIHPDDAVNGVYLPNRFNTDPSVPGILHNGRHPDAYIEKVNDGLVKASKLGDKQSVLKELDAIRQTLLNASRNTPWKEVL